VPVQGRLVLNDGRDRRRLKVTSKGDRPIQVRAQNRLADGTCDAACAPRAYSSCLLDWVPLSSYRGKPAARIRQAPCLWLPFGYSSGNVCSLRARNLENGSYCDDWR
jgi:hypothetical protein